MARRRRSRLLQQARTQAAVQVSPERSALLELAREAGDTREHTIRASKGVATGIKRAVQLARPQIHAIYEQAGKTQSDADAAILGDLAKLSGSADPFKAAHSREAAGAARRIGESEAAAAKELEDRALAAEEGRAFAVNNAESTYAGSLGKVQGRLIDLARQEGLLTSSGYGQLREKAAGRAVTRRGQDVTRENSRASRAQSERNSLRSSGIDPDTGLPIPGGKLDPKAKAKTPGRTPAERRALRKATAQGEDAIADAQNWVRRLKQGGSSDAAIRNLLRSGGSLNVPVKDPATGKNQTTGGKSNAQTKLQKVTVPKFAKTFINAAFDLEAFGYLSRPNVHALRVRDIHVRDEWLPRRSRARVRRPNTVRGPET